MMIGPPEMIVHNMNLSSKMVGSHQPSPQVHQEKIMINGVKRGLNIKVNGNHKMNAQRPSPNTSLTKGNGLTRAKSMSNEKIFLTLKK